MPPLQWEKNEGKTNKTRARTFQNSIMLWAEGAKTLQQDYLRFHRKRNGSIFKCPSDQKLIFCFEVEISDPGKQMSYVFKEGLPQNTI